MPVKYECPKCEKRFVDWGAERMGYKCPQCEGVQLVRVGAASEDKPAKRPTLKRKPKVERVKVPDDTEFELVASDDDVVEPELVVDEVADVLVDEDEDAVEVADTDVDEVASEDDDEEVEDEEVPKDLDFEDVALNSGIDLEDKL